MKRGPREPARGPGLGGALVGGLLVGGGVLLGAALAGAFADAPRPPVDLLGSFTPRLPPPAVTTAAPAPRAAYRPPSRDPVYLADRARRIRVLLYRIRRGEISLASPEVDIDVSAELADALESDCTCIACFPSAAAEGALPLDWQ